MATWINQIVQGVLLGGLYAMFALGLSLAAGVMRFINIAHGDLIVLVSFLILSLTTGLGLSPLAATFLTLPLAFAQPLVLIGLLALPMLWWLLRLVPPRPRRINFPPTRILFEIAPKEETPSRTPWWLILLRLLLAALSLYAALALELEATGGHAVLPLGRRGQGAEAMTEGWAAQVRAAQHEPGVRRQL